MTVSRPRRSSPGGVRLARVVRLARAGATRPRHGARRRRAGDAGAVSGARGAVSGARGAVSGARGAAAAYVVPQRLWITRQKQPILAVIYPQVSKWTRSYQKVVFGRRER